MSKAAMMRVSLATTLLAMAQLVSAQEPTPAPTPTPCDPGKGPCVSVEGWVLAQRTFALGVDPRDLPGGRLQAEVHFKRWRVAARGDATGLQGEFDRNKPETFKAVEAYLAGAYDAINLPNVVTIGPAAAVGAGTSLELRDGEKPSMPKRMTFGLGARVSWPGGWGYVIVGQHQSLRGVAAIATWQIRVSDRVANIGTAAIGARSYFATIGLGVRFK